MSLVTVWLMDVGAVEMQRARVANKEMRIVLKEAMALGWYIARTGKHIQLKHPDGFHFTICGTPKNATACRKKAFRDLHKFDYTTRGQ